MRFLVCRVTVDLNKPRFLCDLVWLGGILMQKEVVVV